MNLLIVDDDSTSLKLLRAQLEAEGHAVFEAHDGVDALALLERQRVDAVISDILMPRMDGYRLCYEIREHARLYDLPIIIYTSTYTAPGDTKLALDVGAGKYLKKPASVETIIAALHEVIAQPHAAPRPAALSEVKVLREYSQQLVSKLKEKNTELMASEERFRALVENSSDGIMLLGRDGKVFYASPAVTRILGYDVDEMIGVTTSKLVHPDDLHRANERFEATLAADSVPVLAETRYRHKDGSWRYLETVRTNRLNEPAVHAVVVNYRDVTERLRSQEEHRRMEQQFEQAQRINGLGRVAATIAHEFNNMLMGIQPFAEIIRRQAGDDERISKAAEHISNSVRRGKRVTEEILRFTNAVAPALQIINMGEWLTLIEPELLAVAGSGVKMTVVLPAESVFAPCDSAQMQQVITNLVINARDAMPGGGAVTLTLATSTREDNLFNGLSEHERFVRLTVRDTGSGIAPEMLEQIFEPLFTTKRSGTGLGLAVARQVLTQHGGFIFVDNAPGGGTAFHIFLPQAHEGLSTAVAVAVAVAVAAQKTSGRIRRLLLVEDDSSVAAGLSSLLELEKIVVWVVERGREVVRAIEELAPDAIVLDLTLPDIDGREVFAQIAARWPDLPVVFSTGHGGEAELARELSRDHVGFLQKPYELAALLAAIERVL